MNESLLRVKELAELPYVVSVPRITAPESDAWPLLCFLHGYGEGAPMPIRQALTLYGPLAAASSPLATAEFIVVAAQLPARGDIWYRYADSVLKVTRSVQAQHRVNPRKMFLTGFSYGGNGVFDLALEQREFWAALWPVGPTRIPEVDPGRPIWFSSGEISRHYAHAFIRRLHLEPLHQGEPGDRTYVDQGQDHVGTAKLAYQDDRIYRWLLSKELSEFGM
ncbi:MAG TPA: hypothetical protein PLG17_05070 [Thermodesulfobacteriota bacterium]|nr:hypothetical protein [Deltaproteobacteria bacterium]HNR13581.1 hypothetical protein [Thermodesulfobacteriota bacterium]HNU71300.1 hypothetical protein [Thermodesulfobacteriota bacterium]HOC39145.1 hypothetical protein [Thermodesulfobacteriota bacterium]HQO77867.1 hypothetical protein [Thermodesulfobacteriota bacterium]